jgi:alkanesulfonate monooxygenase SsuD/methylene tetrahydromethanopterin reductase-like flavin-dependent oxidoreductase (luciferase family)
MDLKFYFMHFMPYAHLPEDFSDHEKWPSAWVDFPNRFYDPAEGRRLYQRYIKEMVLADELGYDGLIVNEHHNSPYSMMAACPLIAAAMLPQVNRAKICVWGVPINLEFPNRLAEEYAILDVMSGGRVEVAIPLGTGMEYWANPINPATARERMREAIAVMLQAWTADGPTTFTGKYFNYRYLNPWPRPFQKPHPKLYLVGTGSPETIELAAELGLGYSVVFIPIEAQLKTFERLRELAAAHGRTVAPSDTPIGVMAYVAESDEQAEREFRPHVSYFFENLLRTTPRYLAPPGYVSIEQFRSRAASGHDKAHGHFDWDFATKQQRIVAGTPQRVAESIAFWAEQAKSSTIVCHLHLGDMPHWKTVKNLTLFAEEVIPRLRGKVSLTAGHDAAGTRGEESHSLAK